MKEKQLKQLVQQSFTNNRLDRNVVESIAGRLLRKDLKRYLRILKLYKQRMSVTIASSAFPTKAMQKKLASLFPNKDVRFVVDPSLVMGIKILDNDDLFEFNLKKTLNDLTTFISKTYD